MQDLRVSKDVLGPELLLDAHQELDFLLAKRSRHMSHLPVAVKCRSHRHMRLPHGQGSQLQIGEQHRFLNFEDVTGGERSTHPLIVFFRTLIHWVIF